MIHEAVGNRLTCVFVDHGLLRLGEAEEVVRLFRGHYNIPLVHVEAGELFLSALSGIRDPEQKRKIIGRLFIATFAYFDETYFDGAAFSYYSKAKFRIEKARLNFSIHNPDSYFSFPRSCSFFLCLRDRNFTS